ncbi:MAG: hypothetical protein IK006_08290 [Bacteroidaceae bacterium]|nr:hypothetical protein [Bacteroidaceae bacterium]
MIKFFYSTIGVLLFSAVNMSAQDNDVVNLSLNGVETIQINNPEPNPHNNQIWLPEISSNMSFTLFNLPQELTSGYINRVYLDSDYIIVECNQSVLCYDKSGILLNNIGTIDIPLETRTFHLRPSAVFVDMSKKEIWVSYWLSEAKDYHYFYIYGFSGQLIRKVPNLSFQFKDFVVTDNAICTYNGSFHELRNPDNLVDRYYNELSVVGNGQTKRLIPSSPNKDYAAYGTTFNFNALSDSYTFHFMYSNTIYSIDKNTSDVKTKYNIDFGTNGFPDFNAMSAQEVESYIMNNSKGKIGIVQDVLENEKYLVFTYYMNGPIAQSIVIFDKASHSIRYHGSLASSTKITSQGSNPQLIGMDEEKLYFKLFINEMNPLLPTAADMLSKSDYDTLLKVKDEIVVMSVKLK